MLDFNQYQIQSYGRSQDRRSTTAISDSGLTVSITGNGWKKIELPYEITEDTILEFEFRSDRQGDIHAIGFDSDNRESSNRAFKLYGTQSWGINHSEINNYGASGNAGEWQAYSIRVGDFLARRRPLQVNYLTLINDHDVRNADAQSFFRNIRVYEAGPLVLEAGALEGVTSFSNRLTAGNPDHIYRFTVEQTSDFNLVLEGLSADANVVLRTSAASASDSDLGRGEIINTANSGETQSELLYETLLPGEYALHIESVDSNTTDYDLILSATPDEAGTTQQLAVSTATYLGGEGADTAAAVEVSPTHELIVAGNFSASLGTAHTFFGATTTSRGQIAHLSASGREVLSVTHLGDEVNDLEVNRIDGRIVVGGDFGVAVLNAAGDQVLWSIGSEQFGSDVERVAIANDGTVVTLHNRTVTTWDSEGNLIAQATHGRSYVNDIAINPETNLVYVTGFDNKRNRNDSNNPVQVAFLNAFEPDQLDQHLWQNWGFDGNILTSSELANGNQNDMADTRGYRVTIGRDGHLYFLGEVAGGNSIFRWNGRDRSTPTLVKYDAFNNPYNSKSPHQTYYARLDPVTGEIDRGQLAFSRLNGEVGQTTNAFRVEHGSIAADEQGNVYISGQGFSKIQNRDLNQINGQTVGAYVKSDLTALVVASDFQSRRLWTPFTEDIGRGRLQGIAVGQGRAAVLGTVEEGTVITTDDAINPERLDNETDVFLATWGTDSLSEFVSQQVGDAADNLLSGGRSSDLLVGHGGSDRLTGGGGADVFGYEQLTDGSDVITDFGADDIIRISATGFGLVAGENANLSVENIATDELATFLYSQGVLSFDEDGAGGVDAVAIAQLQGNPTLSANQIQIVN